MLKLNFPVWFAVLVFILAFALIANAMCALTFDGSLETMRPWSVWTAYQSHGWTGLRDPLGKALLFAGLLSFVIVYYLHGLIFDVKGTNNYGAARFATLPDLKKAGLLQRYGIVVGRLKGQLIQTLLPVYSNVLLAAPPRAGKGVGVIIPTLLTCPGSVIVYDVKGENFEATARHRHAAGQPVFVFSPWDVTTENGHSLARQSHRFNPLEIISNIADLEDRNTELKTMALSFLVARTRQEESFLGNGIDIFVAVCACAIVRAEKATEKIRRRDPDALRLYASFKDVTDLLRPGVDSDGQAVAVTEVLADLAQIPGLDDQTRSILSSAGATSQKIVDSYLSVLETCGLNIFRDPAVLRALSGNDFDFTSLRRRAQAIYVIVPPDKARQAAPLVRLFMQYTVKTLLKTVPDKAEEPYPVLFMIDEFHTLGRMDAIIDATTVLPGYGGRICIVVQSIESLTDIYGASRKDIVLDTCQLQIYMSPNNPRTLKHISDALGMKTIQQRSVSGKTFAGQHDRSQTYSERAQPLMSPQQIQQMDKDAVIALIQNNPPLFGEKIRYYEDRRFKPLYRSQDSLPWPDVPSVKAGEVTRTEDYLDFGFGPVRKTGAITSKQETEEKLDNPALLAGQSDDPDLVPQSEYTLSSLLAKTKARKDRGDFSL